MVGEIGAVSEVDELDKSRLHGNGHDVVVPVILSFAEGHEQGAGLESERRVRQRRCSKFSNVL